MKPGTRNTQVLPWLAGTQSREPQLPALSSGLTGWWRPEPGMKPRHSHVGRGSQQAKHTPLPKCLWAGSLGYKEAEHTQKPAATQPPALGSLGNRCGCCAGEGGLHTAACSSQMHRDAGVPVCCPGPLLVWESRSQASSRHAPHTSHSSEAFQFSLKLCCYQENLQMCRTC